MTCIFRLLTKQLKIHSFNLEIKKKTTTNPKQKTKTAESDSILPVKFGVRQHEWKGKRISTTFVVSFARAFHRQLLQEGFARRDALARGSQSEVSSRCGEKPSLSL